MLRGANCAANWRGEAGLHSRPLVTKHQSGQPSLTKPIAQTEVAPLLRDPLAPPNAPAEFGPPGRPLEPTGPPSERPSPGSRPTASTTPVQVVPIDHFGQTTTIRDPRTKERSNRPDEVLGGDLDRFLFACLTRSDAPDR